MMEAFALVLTASQIRLLDYTRVWYLPSINMGKNFFFFGSLLANLWEYHVYVNFKGVMP